MNFDLTDEQRMLQEAAREILAARFKSEQIRALAESDDAFDEDLWREMADLNWPGLMVSEEHGGQELGTVELVVLMEQLGYALAPGPILSNTLAGARARGGGHRRAARALSGAAGRSARSAERWRSGTRRRLDPDDITLEPEQRQRRLHAQRREAVRARRRDGRLLDRRRDRWPALHRRARRRRRVDHADADDRRRRASSTRSSSTACRWTRTPRSAATGALELARARAYTALAAELAGVAQRAMEMARRVRQGPQAVRPADRLLPGGLAPLRADAARDRGRALGGLLRGLGRRQRARDGAARRLDGEGLRVRRRLARDRRPRSRSTAASASPGSTTSTSGSSAPAAAPSYLGDARWHRERVAQLVIDGDRQRSRRAARSTLGRRGLRPGRRYAEAAADELREAGRCAGGRRAKPRSLERAGRSRRCSNIRMPLPAPDRGLERAHGA